MRSRTVLCGRFACMVTAFCVVANAQASMTELFPPSPGPLVTHEDILETVYGGDFQVSGPDLLSGAGGGVDAIRFDDSLAPNNVINMLTTQQGEASDRFWSDAEISAKAIWRRAIFTQQFGFDRGNGFELLFDVNGDNENVTGSASVDLRGETWSWVRRDQDGTRPWSSDPGMNPDFLDHMVTYELTGLEREGRTFLIFIEDLYGVHTSAGGISDRDFDDLVIEVTAIPEPASAMLLAFGAMALLRRRR